MDFGSGVVLHSKQAHDIRLLALSKNPKNACSKNEDWKGKVRSQELEYEYAYEKVFARS